MTIEFVKDEKTWLIVAMSNDRIFSSDYLALVTKLVFDNKLPGRFPLPEEAHLFARNDYESD
jgi:hypothetical protein